MRLRHTSVESSAKQKPLLCCEQFLQDNLIELLDGILNGTSEKSARIVYMLFRGCVTVTSNAEVYLATEVRRRGQLVLDVDQDPQ
jgi:hypothetical protein